MSVPRSGKTRYERINDFGGGLNTFDDPSEIEDRQTPQQSNVLTEGKTIIRAPGFALYADTGGTRISGLFEYNSANGDSDKIAMSDGKLYRITGGVASLNTDFTWTSSDAFEAVRLFDFSYISNGIDIMKKYNGTNITDVTSSITGAHPVIFKNRQYLAGNTSNSSRLYYSTPVDPGDFSGTGSGFVDISPSDGDEIKRLVVLTTTESAILVVMKERTSWRYDIDIQGISTVSLLSASNGAVSHRAGDSIGNDEFHLTKDGFFKLGYDLNFFNAIRGNDVSIPIKNNLRSLSAPGLKRVAVKYFDKRIYIAVPEGGSPTNNKVYILDTLQPGGSAYTSLSGISANCWMVSPDDVSQSDALFYGDENSGKIYQMNKNYNRSGLAYESSWRSKRFNFGSESNNKRFSNCWVTFSDIYPDTTVSVLINGVVVKTITLGSTQSQSIGALASYAYGEIDLAGGTGVTQASKNYRSYKINIGKIGKSAEIIVSNNKVGQGFRLHAIEWQYIPFVLY